MITKLILENFTVFEKLELELSQGVNVIIGKNGTGKTHVLKIIYSLLAAKNEDFYEQLGIETPNYIIGISKVFNISLKLENLVRRYQGKLHEKATIKISYKNNGKIIKQNIIIKNLSTKKDNSGIPIPVSSFSCNQIYQNEVVYIPAKERLSDAPGFRSLYGKREVNFSITDYDLIVNACLPKLRQLSPSIEKMADKIEKAIRGKVVVEGNDQFFLETDYAGKIEFDLVAEGICKLSLLWLLIRNGSICKDSLLLWDEPEANMNPLLISKLVEILLQLEREGVQIILATHSYVLLKEFDLQRQKKNKLMFHAFYRKDENQPVRCESAEQYLDIENNAIHEEFDSLYDRQVEKYE